MLRRVPAMPDAALHRKPLRKVTDGDTLLVYGHSRWEATGSKECGLGETVKNTGGCPLILGVRRATSVDIGDAMIQQDINIGKIAVLVLGLAYIFSQRLIELQGQGDGVSLSGG